MCDQRKKSIENQLQLQVVASEEAVVKTNDAMHYASAIEIKWKQNIMLE